MGVWFRCMTRLHDCCSYMIPEELSPFATLFTPCLLRCLAQTNLSQNCEHATALQNNIALFLSFMREVAIFTNSTENFPDVVPGHFAPGNDPPAALSGRILVLHLPCDVSSSAAVRSNDCFIEHNGEGGWSQIRAIDHTWAFGRLFLRGSSKGTKACILQLFPWRDKLLQ